MSSAEILRQLKIKSNTLKRIHKELVYYEKQQNTDEKKVETMKAEGADPHRTKQAENVLQETTMMIPETRQRLEVAFNDLQSFLSDNDTDVSGSEEEAAAKEVLEAVRSVFTAA